MRTLGDSLGEKLPFLRRDDERQQIHFPRPVGALGIAVNIVRDAVLFDGAANRAGAVGQFSPTRSRRRLGQARPMAARPPFGVKNFVVTIGVNLIIHKCF